jgi:hypothetical protein
MSENDGKMVDKEIEKIVRDLWEAKEKFLIEGDLD